MSKICSTGAPSVDWISIGFKTVVVAKAVECCCWQEKDGACVFEGEDDCEREIIYPLRGGRAGLVSCLEGRV